MVKLIKELPYFWPLLAVCALSTVGCGTITPIPAQGGGKRFAVEQALISASARKAISEIPLEKIVGKSIALEVSVIQDEGGGAITVGGRPYAASILSSQYDRVRSYVNPDNNATTTGTSTSNIGFRNGQSEPTYFKDMTYNGSDARQFSNLVTSMLLRRNVLINPDSATKGSPDYMLEILVDVFGIWRSRTDWFIYNAETLMATTSFEYVLTPLKNSKEDRVVGRSGIDATYKEKYAFWVGPYDTEMELVPSAFTKIIGTFGNGDGGYSNLAIEGTTEFVKPRKPTPIILNPTDELLRRTN